MGGEETGDVKVLNSLMSANLKLREPIRPMRSTELGELGAEIAENRSLARLLSQN